MPRRKSSLHEDNAHIVALGHKVELKRNFSTLSMLGLAFAILNSWTVLAASLSLALPAGGPSSVIWGLVTAGVCNLCLAASLAEMLSAYPTAGGQYHFVAMIAWKRSRPALSWIAGWVNVAGWIALVAPGGLLAGQLVTGIIALMHEEYEAKPWHQFLVYIGYNAFAFLMNAFGTRLLPSLNRVAFFWSVAGFAIISITLLACAAPDYGSGAFVYREFFNKTGWPDGLAWLLGLLQGALGLTAYDAVSHMIEELPNPTYEGPKVMLVCVCIGLVTGFVFLSILLFVAGNIDEVIEAAAGPTLQIFYNATQSKAGSICMLLFPLICLVFGTTAIMTTSSRMTYAFARDGGLPFSRVFARVHQGLHLPLNALILTTVLVVIFGCLFLGSDSALNAIISAAVVCLNLSYALPPAINCLRGRNRLPATRPFKMPPSVGWTANLIGIAYALITAVLFLFPPELPVTASNMNYCVAAFAVVILVSAAQWLVDGRANYTGPQIDAAALQQGEAAGMAAEEVGSEKQMEKALAS